MSTDGIDRECPVCGNTLDAAAGIRDNDRKIEMADPDVCGGPAPKSGDTSICSYCRALLRYTNDGFYWMSSDDFLALPDDYKEFLARAIILMSAVDGGPPVMLLARPWGPVH